MPYNRLDFAREPNVSRETVEAFEHWYGLLEKWNRRINLVSKTTLDGFWQRHALDSWQVTAHIPETARLFLDLGSGAGFPGIATAIYGKHVSRGSSERKDGNASYHTELVESAGKKASFLRTVIRELNLPAQVRSERAEDLAEHESLGLQDVITARAFAPLPKLLTYAHPFWGSATIGLFLKGQNAAAELTAAQKYWTFHVETVPSRSDPEGLLLKISDLKAKPGAQSDLSVRSAHDPS